MRWQIEILFKELKSFARLGRWNTRKGSMMSALVWASVLVVAIKRFLAHSAMPKGRVASTLTAAKAIPLLLSEVLHRLAGSQTAGAAFRKMMAFLRHHAPRAHPKRDRREGRLACGQQAACR